MRIKQLNIEDAEKYKSIRLQMLKEHPEAFGGSYEESKELDLSFFEEFIQNNFIIGVFDKDRLVGSLGGYINNNQKCGHTANMFGVYIEKDFRGQRLIEKMISILISILPTQIEQIKTSVNKENIAAFKSYQNIGFEEYGTEPRTLKIDGQYFDTIHMIKFFENKLTGSPIKSGM